jgi:hypothetical protein
MMAGNRYLSSVDPLNEPELLRLRQRMSDYYQNAAYHENWIKGFNSNWAPATHPPQCDVRTYSARHLRAGAGMW